MPAPEGPIGEDYIRKAKSEKKIEKKIEKNSNQKFHKANSGSGLYPSIENSFYGQKMHPNNAAPQRVQPAQGMQRYPMQPLGGIQQYPGMYPYPPGMQPYPRISPYPSGMQPYPRMQPYPGMPYNINNYPNSNLYPYGGAMYPPSNMGNPGYMPNKAGNIPPGYRPFNDESDGIGCNIQ